MYHKLLQLIRICYSLIYNALAFYAAKKMKYFCKKVCRNKKSTYLCTRLTKVRQT